MELRPLTEKPKSHKGLGCFLVILLILGFIVGVILVSKGFIRPDQIPHP